MDIFWFIPLVILVVAFCCAFYAHVCRQSGSHSTPNVVVDKPSDPSAVDEAVLAHNWAETPCGSFLDWRAGRRLATQKSHL